MKLFSPLLSFSFIYSCRSREDYFSSDQLPSKNTGDHICNGISQSKYNALLQNWPGYHGYHTCCFNYVSLAAFQQCQNEGKPRYQATAARTVIQSISMRTQKGNKARNAFKWPLLNHRSLHIVLQNFLLWLKQAPQSDILWYLRSFYEATPLISTWWCTWDGNTKDRNLLDTAH